MFKEDVRIPFSNSKERKIVIKYLENNWYTELNPYRKYNSHWEMTTFRRKFSTAYVWWEKLELDFKTWKEIIINPKKMRTIIEGATVKETADIKAKELQWVIYKTENGNFWTIKDDSVIWFKENWDILKIEPLKNFDPDWLAKNCKRVRADASIYKRLSSLEVTEIETPKNLTPISSIKDFPVFLDESDFSFVVQIEWKFINIWDKEAVDKLKVNFSSLEKLKLEVETIPDDTYSLGERVMLYWPTGTGKTYDFLTVANDLLKKKEISDYDIVTVTDWFEDIDFLAHIVPQESGGIKYAEKKVVDLLRRASKGEKVAILIDEVNRGSKSFLNFLLKMLDAVNGTTYVIDNFIADEKIIIPIENILFFGTMNLWGKYVWTSTLDEALFDRYNVVKYKGYNLDVEKEMIKNFWDYKREVTQIVKYVRSAHKDGDIRAPISTRGIKIWAEAYINTDKSKPALAHSFRRTLLYRILNVDDFWNPNQEEEAIVLKKFKDLGIL